MGKYNKQEYKKVKKIRRIKKFWLILNRYSFRFYAFTNRNYEKTRQELLSMARANDKS